MTVEADRRHLVIFARRPRLGVGKRRLAADVGELAALRFSRAALRVLRRRLSGDPRWTTWIAISPDRPSDWGAIPRLVPQGSGDLGARLRRVLARLPPGPVVVIGSDAPGVKRSDIAAAFAALGRSDAVLGPAHDGGYWLVGLRRRTQLPFEAVRWSGPFALADTVRNLEGRSISWLRLREDVDDGAALARLPARDLRPW